MALFLLVEQRRVRMHTPGRARHPVIPTERNAEPSRQCMSIKNNIRATLLCTLLGLPMLSAMAADQWHFVVKNKTGSKITKLQVSENKSDWGDFDIGSGIGAGKTETLVWDSSTDNEGCDQWIRAKFSDGSFSEASKQDFCQDLEEPIVFEE